jgi:cytochrome c oxidase assembly protein subunit 15
VHFLVSAAVVAAAVVLHDRVSRLDDPEPQGPVRRDLRVLAGALVTVVCLMLAAGTVVTGTGPLAGDAGVPRYRLPLEGATQLHADIGWLLAGLALALVGGLRLSGAPPRAMRAGWIMLAALGSQGVIGYIQYFTHLPAGLVWVHVTGSVLVWIAALRLFFATGNREALADSANLTEPSVTAIPRKEPEPLDR